MDIEDSSTSCSSDGCLDGHLRIPCEESFSFVRMRFDDDSFIHQCSVCATSLLLPCPRKKVTIALCVGAEVNDMFCRLLGFTTAAACCIFAKSHLLHHVSKATGACA